MRHNFNKVSNLIALLFVAVQVMGFSAWAQVATTTAHPTARVQLRVDNNQRAILPGHTLPVLNNATDFGRLSGDTAMNHLVMVLQSSPEQDQALQSLIDQQLDKGHANFHKWMTPEQFGAKFGLADSDIQQVTGWLSQQGFLVENVSPSKRFIQFSGNASQVELAFHTEMHRYSVNGTTHVANSGDISVPAALQPVIAGVPTLHDFFKKSGMGDTKTITQDSNTGKFYFADRYKGTPDYTNGSTHFLGAGDFATVYNTAPLITAGNDGTGVSIGIIGRTDINLGDVQIYRYMFGLKPNDPTFIIAGEDPGVVGGDDGESYLDVEVSGGAAPGASVKFIVSRATLTVDGVDLAALYAVQNNLTDVISESYGQCEANFTSVAAAFYNSLWAQAAAQGQSVFVSSGDNGPASCDNSNNSFESGGYAVSMLASSPYNVAVGGTLFADSAANWNATATTAPPFSSALGYIPEVPWNEAKGSGATGAAGLWSGSGGISAYFTTPSWQRGFGVPASDPAYAGTGAISSPTTPFVAGPHRYLPDVAMAAAADHDGTLYCIEGICQLSSTGSLINAGIVGGTSVAAPTMAGVQALVDQYNGGRQGLPNYVYYALADAQHTAGLVCTSSSASLDPNCAFRDVTTGNNLVCANSGCTTANKIGWTAAAGYDLATGLGSPNATQLAHLWSSITFRSTATTMSLSKTSGITHGQAVTVSGTVAPGSGSGTPTGNVAFIAAAGALGDPINASTGGFQNPVSLATLDGSGHYSLSVANLPAGTYYLTARYGGDGTFAASISSPVKVIVGAEGSGLTIHPNSFNQTTCVETAATTFTYGSYIWTDFTVAGASGQGIPTGTVAITDNGAALLTATLNPSGVAHSLSGAIPSTSCVLGYTSQDTAPPTVGTHLIGANYSGDGNFNSLTATPVTVTITPATITGALATGATNISSGSSVQLTYKLAGISGAGPGTVAPTGTVTFTDTTTSTALGTATLSATSTFGGMAVLTTTGITAAGANSIVASWPGDSNYAAVGSGVVTVTVQGGTSTSVALTSNANPTAVGGRPTWTATMTPTTVTGGTVNFFADGVLLGTGTVGAAHTATFQPASTVNLPAGIRNIVAVYAGNATFNASTSPTFAQTFNPASTTVTLTVKSSGGFGQAYTLAGTLGTVISATPPTGTLTFFDGATPLGSASLTTVSTASGGLGLYSGQIYVSSFSVGTHTITAQLTDTNYTAPTSTSQTITVSQGSQTITFASQPGTVTYQAVAPLTFSATANSGLPVTYSVSGPATISGNKLTVTGAGTIVVTASQAGNSNYLPATATQTIVSSPATYSPVGSSTQAQGSPTATTVTLTSESTFTLGSLSVTATGAPGTPFVITSGGTCSVGATYLVGETCTVKLNFTPTGPGLITGVVQGLDNSGTPVLQMMVNSTAVRYR